MTSSAARPPRRLLAAATGLLLALSACSTGGEESVPDAEQTAPASESTTPQEAQASLRTVGGRYLLGRWPLTGRPAKGMAPRRPVLAVKVDNTSSSAPQVGLGAADMVIEQIVEGGQTRLVALYYQRLPQVVGPVRSLRATDLPLVRPAGDAVVVASGGAPPTIRRFDRAGVKIRTESAQGFFRAGDRVSPYNLMVRMPDLQRSVQRQRAVPRAYLPWGNTEITGPRARSVVATFSAARSTVWQYRGGKYQPQSGYQAAGDRFVPDTILALRVRLGDAGYRDPAGNPVPETPLVGRGDAVVFHGGRLQRATWVKSSPRAPLRLQDRRGRAVSVPAGRTWVELVPTSGGGAVSWSAR
ncbi:DUF3048 domain-containing protein [Nocardioidaceae bacterium]|nr:DUF3048 domain-containing protein [Nocardioidaceae bacterium]